MLFFFSVRQSESISLFPDITQIAKWSPELLASCSELSGAAERDSHDAAGMLSPHAFSAWFFLFFFLQVPLNETPRCHHWQEAPTAPVIHQRKPVRCVCETRPGGAGSRGVWIEAAGFNSGCVGDSACPGAERHLLLPGAGEVSYTAVCIANSCTLCSVCSEKLLCYRKKKIHFRNTGQVS